ncbi:hypothetical protein JOC78_003529 [Bacillus ectoiniformans]|uniref:hypothetical protein n=1 Tax=Bacillus ectoiniformans TaxID=1494429 RepID=UPI00195DD7CB|nr:hypothetical protein [Bacillus ectoiniformans]MBM7650532.1 hypothetical protein [Bacillus ectoiniformans]
MNINQLEKELDESVQTFNEEVNSLLSSHKKEHFTADDMEELGRQVYYTFNEFKGSLIKYLKQLEK